MGEKGTVWSNITRCNVRLRGTDFFWIIPWNTCRKYRNSPCNINKIYYLTLILSFFKFIFRLYHLYIVCSRRFHERTFVFNQFASHSRKSRVEKNYVAMTNYDILHFFCSNLQLMSRAYRQCAPPPLLLEGGGGGGELPTKFSKRRGLIGPQLLERVDGKKGMNFFKGAMQLSHTKKIKI